MSTEVYEISTFDCRRGVGTIRISPEQIVHFNENHFQARYAPKPGRKVTVEFDSDGRVTTVVPVPIP